MRTKLSVIAEIDDEKCVAKFCTSLKNEMDGENCEVFLIGGLSGKKLEKVQALNDESFSVQIVGAADDVPSDVPRAFNNILHTAAGDIIHIAKTSCEYEKGGIKRALQILEGGTDARVVGMSPYTYSITGEPKRIRYFPVNEEYPVKIDLCKTPERWCRSLFSLFISRETAEDLRFDSRLEYEYERAFIAMLFASEPVYYLLKQKVFTHGFTDVDNYNYHPAYDLDWYTRELNIFADILLGINDVNRVNQRILMDFITVQYNANRGDREKSLLKGDMLEEYKNIVARALSGIDDDIISILSAGQHQRLPLAMYTAFLCMKYGRDTIESYPVKLDDDIRSDDGYAGNKYDFVTDSGAVLSSSDMISVYIRAVNREGGYLVIDAELNNACFAAGNELGIYISGSDGARDRVEENNNYSLVKFFDKAAFRRPTFRFRIPLGRGRSSYHLEVDYKDITFVPRMRFVKSQARIADGQKYNYWSVGGRILHYDATHREFVLRKAVVMRRIGCELAYRRGIWECMHNKKRALSFIGIRMLYFITKPYYGRKNIWITFDQMFKGGDNGEYFFRYVSEHGNGGQTLYYVINKDTKEYEALRAKYRNVLAFSSLKNKVISLHAKTVFTTRADVTQYLGFSKTAEIYFRNLFNYDAVCLQHGLSIQQIAQYQNRTFDNLKYYFCVSKYEIDNLSQPIYGFYDKSMLALTGAPRYDGLVGTPEKQIIISPTWRRNVTSGTNKKGHNHEYSSNFKDTVYYQIYNGLINDERLLSCARETGYKLIYLIHPILSPQINDFDRNDVLKIVPGSEVNYEKILVDSALMLTDHSGIMYDFAYQRKPLIYYHPEELPPQYAEGGLNYETMGFGPVCKTRDEVVEQLCRFMKNGCRLDAMYKERIEDFFEFDDQNNCERVYKAALEFEKRRSRSSR